MPATGARGAVAAPGEEVLAVPAYLWHDGCGPTSAGMVIGYWDGQGFPDLVPGDASGESDEVYQMIASHGTALEPGHYEDYALPLDDDGIVIADRSEAPEGDEHESDSLADFMGTSFSVNGLSYGWSFTSRVGPALVGYTRLRLSGVAPASQHLYYDSSGPLALTFERLRQEIDAARPLVLFVDCSGDGVTDHAVTGIGYREISGYPEYACWDTWSKAIRWQRFRATSSTYAWGVSSAVTFVPDGTQWPQPGEDTTPPVTSVDGAGGWSRTPVTLTFTAADEGSGVEFTSAGVDDAELMPLSGLPATLVVAAQGEHVVRYRSTDKKGNVEAVRTCTVRIDGLGPVTRARAARVRRGARVTLRYRVDDMAPKADVRLAVRSRDGRMRALLKLGWRGTNTLRSARWRCRLPRGTYRILVLATDRAGNRQSTTRAARLTVR